MYIKNENIKEHLKNFCRYTLQIRQVGTSTKLFQITLALSLTLKYSSTINFGFGGKIGLLVGWDRADEWFMSQDLARLSVLKVGKQNRLPIRQPIKLMSIKIPNTSNKKYNTTQSVTNI